MAARGVPYASTAALALLALLGCGRPPSLLVVTLDTTRVDHLSCYGYARKTTPSLDALAEQSVRFTRAWSTSSWTLPAHASLFTGLDPSAHGAHFDSAGDAVLGSVIAMAGAEQVRAGKLPDSAETLAERLAARGYATAAFVAGPWLHRDFGLLQGFSHVDDEDPSFAGRPAERISDLAIDWLTRLDPDVPYFLFVNYFDPHIPYSPPEGYRSFPGANAPFLIPYAALNLGERSLSPIEKQVTVSRYDGEIRYMDHHLGRLLDAVRARDGDAPMIVVVADHGEAFGEDGRYGHTYWLSEELLRIPMLVRLPGARRGGTVEDAPTQLVDLLPLIAEELSFELPGPLDGVLPGERQQVFAELFAEPARARRDPEHFDRDLKSLTVWPHKLVRSSTGRTQLYTLHADLRETALDDPTLARDLGAALDAQEQATSPAQVTLPSADPEVVESLRRLGYVE